jgi:ribonuclease D
MRWVDDERSLGEAMDAARQQTLLAVDTEADSLHSYFDKVCLIQLTAGGEDYVIDPLARLDLAPLGEILADDSITKVLHGADYDIRILNRDFGFTVTNLIDTMICSQLLGLEAIGLAALLKRYFDIDADKKHQKADWAQRPLPREMLEYAARDTHYLARIAEYLRGELETLGRWEWAAEEFIRLETLRYREPDDASEAFRKIKGASKLGRRSLGALANLAAWRDGEARRLDRPLFKVMMNETLVAIATALPESADELKKIRGMSREQIGRRGDAILAAVRGARETDESGLPPLGETRQWKRDREVERRIDRLKVVRDEAAAALRIDPGVLAPRHVLTAIATERPKSIDDLDGIPALRLWQKRLVGERLLAALAE